MCVVSYLGSYLVSALRFPEPVKSVACRRVLCLLIMTRDRFLTEGAKARDRCRGRGGGGCEPDLLYTTKTKRHASRYQAPAASRSTPHHQHDWGSLERTQQKE